MAIYYAAGIQYSDELWHRQIFSYPLKYSKSELFHHGIKGQKWGEQNGPPYPLDDGNHSEKENKSNWKKSLNKDESGLGNWSDKHHLTKQQKALIAAGVIATAAIGAAIIYDKKTGKISSSIMVGKIKTGQDTVKKQIEAAGYSDSDLIEAAKSDQARDLIEDSREMLETENVVRAIDFKESVENGTAYGGKLSRMISERDASSDFGAMTKLEHASSILEDARTVNPNFDVNNKKTTNNCGLCSMAYDLRRRGYNAFAGLSDSGTSTKDILDLYPGTKKVVRFGDYATSACSAQPPMKSSDVSKVIDSFSKEAGTRGTLFVSWGYTGGGHAMSYEVSSSGELSIIDSQVGNVYTGKTLNKFLETVASIDSFRLDNIEPNIGKMMRRNLVL